LPNALFNFTGGQEELILNLIEINFSFNLQQFGVCSQDFSPFPLFPESKPEA
jgi:hypothetical protein